ncbi:MAG: ribitol-5-phosphate dehydrogenase [Methanobrevibacter sp.]|uniref:ribitol-5-phosphate dehydrogenase n=1 Tax=Methanobrevibacter sp. TaxID=66852 RepID=UPI0026DFFDC5|nr:ribitol-5-phosphate dehydrogenase [Methanobrevibacter sp.]MDO5849527.1 ribitol-5-phosphate dehydrogenase [Methanobrevibacter sp.]
MINSVYRLTSPGIIEETFIEVDLDDDVVIRPTYMSICQADQRYFRGNRAPEILKQKLPMALIHEAVGEVVRDFTGTFKPGDKVVVIPNTPTEEDDIIQENYIRSSRFRSSGFDGFMSDYVISKKDRVIRLPDDIDLRVASFIELISVSVHAISRFEMFAHERKNRIGVWGDGNVGFITSLLLKIFYPDCEVIVFGKNLEKLSYFSFADDVYNINEIPEGFSIDHGFECVGGFKAESAINQIIDIINPQGSIALLGVSENNVGINTRMVLEKGLNLFGSSRSGREDFEKTVQMISENEEIVNYLESLIANVVPIKSIKDITEAFNADFNSGFGKTILEWNK